MPGALLTFVRLVNRFNRRIGRITMYGIFAIMGVLLYATFMKAVFVPPLWTLEMAQFLMVGYFLMGGAYALQMDAHVRMDLIYANLTPLRKAGIDALTILFLIFYLVMLLVGGWSSTSYALEFGERSYSSWRPAMAPIKLVMVTGIALSLLQAIAIFITDIARLRGIDFDDGFPPGERGT